MTQPKQVVLLRVGVDTGSGGILGPIFDDDTFDFVPICDCRDRLGRTYGNTAGTRGRKLIDYFPGPMQSRMNDVFLHADPEFNTYTYGDPTSPKQKLKNLRSQDLLVFYAGLEGWKECQTPAGLYIVGYFIVEQAGTYTEMKSDGVLQHFSKNWHVLNNDINGRLGRGRKRRTDLVLVKGGRGSRLLKKAVRISASEKAQDGGGHPVFVLDSGMKRHFGNFTTLNAIQRSIPRFVKPEHCESAAEFVLKLE